MNKTKKGLFIKRCKACGLKNESVTQLTDDYFNANNNSGNESEGYDIDYEDIPNVPTSTTGSQSETISPNVLENEAMIADSGTEAENEYDNEVIHK